MWRGSWAMTGRYAGFHHRESAAEGIPTGHSKGGRQQEDVRSSTEEFFYVDTYLRYENSHNPDDNWGRSRLVGQVVAQPNQPSRPGSWRCGTVIGLAALEAPTCAPAGGT